MRFKAAIFTAILSGLILLTSNVQGQSPERMSYQAIVRNASNGLLTNATVGVRISIIQGSVDGTSVYSELHNPQTNINGLMTLQVGGGTPESGDFSTIDWSNGPFFIKTETDPDGGTNYTISGTSQFLSVPYALHATTADALTNPVPEVDGDPTNELQDLSLNGDTIFISGGNYIVIPGIGSLGVSGPEATVQQRLNSGETPFDIYNSDNTLLDSLYGKTYGGGLIFYLDTSDGSGMVCAENDQSDFMYWYNCYYSVTGATDSGIGTGVSNTATIIGSQGFGNYGAIVCDNLILNMQEDWYLPSQDELGLMHTNLGDMGMGNFAAVKYWSSTELDNINAYTVDFNTGLQAPTAKHEFCYVRAVRSFIDN